MTIPKGGGGTLNPKGLGSQTPKWGSQKGGGPHKGWGPGTPMGAPKRVGVLEPQSGGLKFRKGGTLNPKGVGVPKGWGSWKPEVGVSNPKVGGSQKGWGPKRVGGGSSNLKVWVSNSKRGGP